jgi:hypothetical protein
VFLTLFGLAFFGMGALFIGLILRDVRKDAQTRNWAPTECTILESGVVPDYRGLAAVRPHGHAPG